MAGQAFDVLSAFWRAQDRREYPALTEFFADDAVVSDPMWGTYKGKEAIAGFMAKMAAEMGPNGIHFELLELSGDQETVWARWMARTPRGDREGVGIYKVKNGKIVYYRDYIDPPPKKA